MPSVSTQVPPVPETTGATAEIDYLTLILTSRVYDVAVRTDLQPAPGLSARLGNNVLLKREDQQPIFSFKLRGAYNKIAHLSAEELSRGVICASAGNHAQGVAYSAQKLGIRAVIVMPATTPSIKVEACRARGAEVVLHGDSYSDAEALANELVATGGMTLVHPYDDPLVIAGQGTIGAEIATQLPMHDYTVFIPIGGGGLIAGVGSYLKRLNPRIRIIGVEPDDSDAMSQSIAADERVRLDHVGIFVDGVAVKQVGALTFELVKRVVDEIVTVSTDEVCAAIEDVFVDTRSIQEPAGALAVAGMKKYARERSLANETLVALTCGANVNFDRLRLIAERVNYAERTEALLAVTIPERPGAYLHLIRTIGRRSVTEFNYRYAPASEAHVLVGVRLNRPEERDELIEALQTSGFAVVDLSHDEVALSHARHMVGGRAPEAHDERLFRFEFPERPGALLGFLEALDPQWNISLFHYRSHGAAHGRVLAGVQVPDDELDRFRQSLDKLGYPYVDEGQNPAYRLFLS
jgi:threonine dehydratase